MINYLNISYKNKWKAAQLAFYRIVFMFQQLTCLRSNCLNWCKWQSPLKCGCHGYEVIYNLEIVFHNNKSFVYSAYLFKVCWIYYSFIIFILHQFPYRIQLIFQVPQNNISSKCNVRIFKWLKTSQRRITCDMFHSTN